MYLTFISIRIKYECFHYFSNLLPAAVRECIPPDVNAFDFLNVDYFKEIRFNNFRGKRTLLVSPWLV